jgi:hypothetical protein
MRTPQQKPTFSKRSLLPAKTRQRIRSRMATCLNRLQANSFKSTISSDFWDSSSGPSLPSDLSQTTLWIRRFFATFLLLPLVLLFSMTIVEQLSSHGSNLELWLSTAVWYSIMGATIWLILYFSGIFPSQFLYIYVLGHELTHVLATYMCLGRVSDFHVGLEGGYIQTNKSNLFIALSPYFIPLWTLVWTGIGVLIIRFYSLGNGEPILYGGFGFWWAFHITWTIIVIPKDQPDLHENGTFFSLLLICATNQIILIALLMLSGFIDSSTFFTDFAHNATTLWQGGRSLTQSVLHFFSQK